MSLSSTCKTKFTIRFIGSSSLVTIDPPLYKVSKKYLTLDSYSFYTLIKKIFGDWMMLLRISMLLLLPVFSFTVQASAVYFTETELFLNPGSGFGDFDSGQLQQNITTNLVSTTSSAGQPISAEAESNLSTQKVGSFASSGTVANASTASAVSTLLDTYTFDPLTSDTTISYSIIVSGSIIDRSTGMPAGGLGQFDGGSLVWGFGSDAMAIATDADRVNPNFERRGNFAPELNGSLDIDGGELSLSDLFDGTISSNGSTTLTGSILLASGTTEFALYLSLGLGTANSDHTFSFLNSADFLLDFPLGFEATRASGLPLQPVPLPAAFWLFGSALAGLGIFRIKRNNITS